MASVLHKAEILCNDSAFCKRAYAKDVPNKHNLSSENKYVNTLVNTCYYGHSLFAETYLLKQNKCFINNAYFSIFLMTGRHGQYKKSCSSCLGSV